LPKPYNRDIKVAIQREKELTIFSQLCISIIGELAKLASDLGVMLEDFEFAIGNLAQQSRDLKSGRPLTRA